MLLSPKEKGVDSLFKEDGVFKGCEDSSPAEGGPQDYDMEISFESCVRPLLTEHNCRTISMM